MDPHLGRIPPLFRRGQMQPGDPETAHAVGDFCAAVLERVAEQSVAIKPQSAFFEQLGPAGVEVLAGLLADGRRRGVPMILDAKRGDIGSTAAGYAAAYVAKDAPMAADALTINPYLGADSLEPFLEESARSGAGLFVLVRTSNPGGADLQALEVEGQPLYLRVADLVARAAADRVGPETGWSSIGAVVGATRPDEAPAVRERIPNGLFLVPGYGAQGGSARDALRGFVPGPGGVLEGGVVSSSRGILFPEGSDTDDATAWERAIDAAVERAVSELGEAARA